MNEEPKKRKRTSGVIRDKERTKIKMIQAVGKVLSKKGYTGLNASSISKEAGVDKSLVWTYFGGIDNLVEQYLSERDFLNTIGKNDITLILQNPEDLTAEKISSIFHNQLDSLLDDKIMQKIIQWEICENKTFLRNLADMREELGEFFFKIVEPKLNDNTINLRGVLAIIVAGNYYLALHSKVNGSLFCGIDLNTNQGRQQIKDTISSIISFSTKNLTV